MKLINLCALSILGWFLLVAPSPTIRGQFDANAPITAWTTRASMFRSEHDCETFRARVARSGIAAEPKIGQFITDDEFATRIIPLSASRCFDTGKNSVNIPG